MKRILIAIMMLPVMAIAQKKERYFAIQYAAQSQTSWAYVTIGRHFPQYPSMVLLQAHGACIFNNSSYSGSKAKFDLSDVRVIVTELNLRDYRDFFQLTEYTGDTAYSYCDKEILSVYKSKTTTNERRTKED